MKNTVDIDMKFLLRKIKKHENIHFYELTFVLQIYERFMVEHFTKHWDFGSVYFHLIQNIRYVNTQREYRKQKKKRKRVNGSGEMSSRYRLVHFMHVWIYQAWSEFQYYSQNHREIAIERPIITSISHSRIFRYFFLFIFFLLKVLLRWHGIYWKKKNKQTNEQIKT